MLVSENQQLAGELRESITRKFEKRKVYSSFKGNSRGVDLADMQLISKFNKTTCFLFCVFDMYSKCECKVLPKDKKLLQLLILVKTFLISLIGNETKYK